MVVVAAGGDADVVVFGRLGKRVGVVKRGRKRWSLSLSSISLAIPMA